MSVYATLIDLISCTDFSNVFARWRTCVPT